MTKSPDEIERELLEELIRRDREQKAAFERLLMPAFLASLNAAAQKDKG